MSNKIVLIFHHTHDHQHYVVYLVGRRGWRRTKAQDNNNEIELRFCDIFRSRLCYTLTWWNIDSYDPTSTVWQLRDYHKKNKNEREK